MIQVQMGSCGTGLDYCKDYSDTGEGNPEIIGGEVILGSMMILVKVILEIFDGNVILPKEYNGIDADSPSNYDATGIT